ncbi:glyoxylase-like metal-dependent hydrolase (beta-lactamase superfamily II) [Saccharopolyspora erythraea NRRL 2338]|uniref:Metallo-beta-lactamase n=2 Tax=Saccharopolyspora erythraea TaxID=1836 RepID=A4FPD5_SACEN|nr:MBL fold metallo-hydrolase [Saccharopolyspora erythraea]EQD86722.1 beta-lactamase [Saccharopolyspora erythraea D]PFG99551.1 glyoxylase-like metal-dependent hydrolase (beta-lactamase superfamily II) [Saccharopolyspora erythraea NRRL 2338]QRK89451.1 MBL fold metallo-hydrolase [Saccharopolyspora erythraea]CAM05910.1 metallo-beta-lactamase [Saccharopolyspora erythraea NRRL 2338]
MRTHHLNCGTLTVDPSTDTDAASAVCHCLLIETDETLVLLETGLGMINVRRPQETLGDFVDWAGPKLDPEETAVRQVERLGFAPSDVGHVILTHLHIDHTGGLPDFPHAAVHVHEVEHRLATSTAVSQYPQAHFAHGPNWVVYPDGGERWRGFDGVRQFDGLPPELLMVPMPGHTHGHVGVAIDQGDRWLLHAGDTYYSHVEIETPSKPAPPVLEELQRSVEDDRAKRLAGVERLRAIAGDADLTIVSAHDPWELDRAVRSPS